MKASRKEVDDTLRWKKEGRKTHRFFPPFCGYSIGTHFYLEICVRLDHIIDIGKGLWRSED
ncbi:hypothetical protein E2C01_057794 [Portunus trituberculatus]|uniref:Uncharacterized protein n=1 Tax=Portunus trituberculatus TaxID=210409 RepID=A0A5B7GXY8_PORTR|nr:hypothetical protein [Portunus trituberculatus]